MQTWKNLPRNTRKRRAVLFVRIYTPSERKMTSLSSTRSRLVTTHVKAFGINHTHEVRHSPPDTSSLPRVWILGLIDRRLGKREGSEKLARKARHNEKREKKSLCPSRSGRVINLSTIVECDRIIIRDTITFGSEIFRYTRGHK